ncbi:MAG: arsenic resistance N-acetyltransferase ArsN2 [Woeseiaceae bacterium]
MTATIRKAREKDWPALKRLLLQAKLPLADLSGDQLQQFLVAEDRQAMPPTIDGLIGLQTFGHDGLLRSLVVHAGQRGSGIGRRLVMALEENASAAGVAEIWLLTIDAEVFFWKLGYRIADRGEAPETIRATAEFANLCPESAHLMHKTL